MRSIVLAKTKRFIFLKLTGFLFLFLIASTPAWSQIRNSDNLSTLANVTIQRGKKSHHFEAAVLAQAPNKLRIEILDDLGQTKFFLIADGQKVLWRDESRGKEKLIPQDPKSLKKSLRIPLSVEEFVALMLRRAPSTEPYFAAEWQDASQSQLKSYQKFRDAKKKKLIYQFESNPGQVLWNFKKPKFQLKAQLQGENRQEIDSSKFEIVKLETPAK